MTNTYLVKILIEYYLYSSSQPLFTRWDTWMVTHGYTREAIVMFTKTNEQINLLLGQANFEAQLIKNSKLYKVLA